MTRTRLENIVRVASNLTGRVIIGPPAIISLLYPAIWFSCKAARSDHGRNCPRLDALQYSSLHAVPLVVDLLLGHTKTSPIDGSAQIKASEDSKIKFSVVRSLVQAKVARNLQVLDWVAQRYDIEEGFN